MDEIRTIQRTIVFNAGCRAKAVSIENLDEIPRKGRTFKTAPIQLTEAKQKRKATF